MIILSKQTRKYYNVHANKRIMKPFITYVLQLTKLQTFNNKKSSTRAKLSTNSVAEKSIILNLLCGA